MCKVEALHYGDSSFIIYYFCGSLNGLMAPTVPKHEYEYLSVAHWVHFH